MKSIVLTFGSLGFLALAVCPASSQEAVIFEARWLNSKKYLQSMVMDQSMKMSFGGQSMDNTIKTEMNFSHVVSAGDETGTQRIKMKYERIAMNIEAMGKKMAYDSAKPDAAEGPSDFADAFKGISGQEFTLILDADGKVKDIENLDSVLAGLMAPPVAWPRTC